MLRRPLWSLSSSSSTTISNIFSSEKFYVESPLEGGMVHDVETMHDMYANSICISFSEI